MLSSYLFVYKLIFFKYFKTVSPAKLFMETESEKLKPNIAESIELQPFDIFTYLFIFLSQKGNSLHEKFIEASILRFHQKEIDAPFSRENDVCIR
jgi:hypothetical protein